MDEVSSVIMVKVDCSSNETEETAVTNRMVADTVHLFNDPHCSKWEGKKVTTPGTENGHVTGKDPSWAVYPWKWGAAHTMSRYNGNNDTRGLVCHNEENPGAILPGE